MQIEIQKLDAIIFDLGGVILNLDYNLTIEAFKHLGGERFDELYTQANQSHIIDDFEIGKATTEEFIRFMLDFLPAENQSQTIVDAWNKMLLDLPTSRIELLKHIGSQKRIFLFSNTNAIHYSEVLQILKTEFGNKNLFNELFEKAYFSHIAGVRKPNKEAFQLVLDENQLDPSKTLFIDDSIQHIEGAQKVGLQTYHLVNEDIIDIFKFD